MSSRAWDSLVIVWGSSTAVPVYITIAVSENVTKKKISMYIQNTRKIPLYVMLDMTTL